MGGRLAPAAVWQTSVVQPRACNASRTLPGLARSEWVTRTMRFTAFVFSLPVGRRGCPAAAAVCLIATQPASVLALAGVVACPPP